MENRYLFKAKRIDNREWEIGSLIALPTGEYEISNKCNNPPDCDPMWDKVVITHKVDPSTICRCTGSKDKNGKLIWEHDIVQDKRGSLYKTFWRDKYYQFSWACIKSDIFRIGAKWDLWSFKRFEIEVIGNMFDNPELVESEE
jgi:uncharacterized phage protein (TIGR01671 family)